MIVWHQLWVMGRASPPDVPGRQVIHVTARPSRSNLPTNTATTGWATAYEGAVSHADVESKLKYWAPALSTAL